MAGRKTSTKVAESDLAVMERQARMLARAAKVLRARESLIDFLELVRPHPEDPDDAGRSRYDAQPFHRACAAALERVERGEIGRLIWNMPPRHGKSDLASRALPAWAIGRDPYRHIMFATYNEEFAADFGRDVRSIMQSAAFRQIFPGCILQKGSQSNSLLETTEGGRIAFVGRGGSITGRGADIIIIDDPLKNSKEADSGTIREELWAWFVKDVVSRCASDAASITVIQTRWHHDDLPGRLTDPTNPCFDPEEAAQWKVVNIPALAKADDPLGRAPGDPLWPGRFGVEFLHGFRRRAARGFAALYQQEPTPDEGDFFEAKMIVPYRQDQLPAGLRIYAASDHAVSDKQRADSTVLLVVGVDQHANIWLLDCWWEQGQGPEEVVEAMLAMMRRWKPLTWWAGRDHISKSMGPFLRTRMRETGTYIHLSEMSEAGDKESKAQAIKGRMSMRMVRFPAWQPWYEPARAQLLQFPAGAHDDFVDALAYLGRGLDRQVPAAAAEANDNKAPRVGTMGWLLRASRAQRRHAAQRHALGGW